jgi:hypothetical protein
MALDPEAQRAWMRQWRVATLALAEQHERELRAMSPAEALAATDALLWLGSSIPLNPARLIDSGLVCQQALLHHQRR